MAVEHMTDLKRLQEKKLQGVRLVERAGQAAGPPVPI